MPAVAKKGIYIIIGEAAGLTGNVLIDTKSVTVVAVKAIAGGQPDETLSILGDRQYGSLGEAVLDIQVVKDQALGISFWCCYSCCQAGKDQPPAY